MEIDFVVTWVDGSDSAWLAEKNKYLPQKELVYGGINRYRDWDLMRYWFRAVEMFAPWVHKVFFVTWGHVPSFLNRGAPKLEIIRHEDFIPQEYLPTFNSRSIEMNLHRITDLAEHFVYFNDDIFILKPAEPDHFFQNGFPRSYGGEVPEVVPYFPADYHHEHTNCLGIINTHFDKKRQSKLYRKKYISACYPWRDNVRTLMCEWMYPHQYMGFLKHHGPAAYLKATFQTVWKAEPAFLDASCREKFRASNQVSQYLPQWWQIAEGTFSPGIIDNKRYEISPTNIEKVCRAIRDQAYHYICLNDSDNIVDDITELSVRLKDAFEAILPNKSKYEL